STFLHHQLNIRASPHVQCVSLIAASCAPLVSLTIRSPPPLPASTSSPTRPPRRLTRSLASTRRRSFNQWVSLREARPTSSAAAASAGDRASRRGGRDPRP